MVEGVTIKKVTRGQACFCKVVSYEMVQNSLMLCVNEELVVDSIFDSWYVVLMPIRNNHALLTNFFDKCYVMALSGHVMR